MSRTMEQHPVIDLNPTLSVTEDGTVLYSNEASEPLLQEWGVRVGEKVPLNIVDLVHRVISRNSPEKIEIKVRNKVYLIVLHPLPEQECINISGFDISDQKEAEGIFRESENKYRNIVQTTVEGIWIFNAVSETTYVNEKMAEMLGYKPEEMIGRFIWDFAYKEDKDIFQIKLANRKQGIDEVYELKLLRKDGSPLWISVSAKGFFNDSGKFVGSVGMFIDITDRKRVEEALRVSEEKFRQMAENIGEVFFIFTSDWKQTVYVSPVYERVWGRPLTDLYGNSMAWLEGVHPDDREFPLAVVKKYIDGNNMGADEVEFRVSRPDGTLRWILARTYPVLDEQGSVCRITGIAEDITERKRVEEALQESKAKIESIFRSAPVGIGVVVNRMITEVNERLCEMTGYSRKELLGKSAMMLYPTVEEYELVGLVKYDMIMEHGTGYVETHWQREDGSIVDILLSSSPIILDNLSGEITFSALDITERKKEEHRILRYNRILNGINRIFNDVIQAKTEEELGNTCLSVAIEITGSQYGFVGELGLDGRLHDIAISDTGWEKCTMYDKTGHRRPPRDFILHGLYGYVIDSENSFFTNDPQSHPCSIGLPQGHPSLLSFLGVPLFEQGKTIGILAVANREGGYSHEQLEDLEAIAPAVTQALKRKREESERKQVEKALSRERNLLENVMQTTDVMLVFLDPQFNFVWVNLAYAETCKMKPEDMVGKNHFDLYPDEENEAIFRQVRDTGEGVFYKDKPFVFTDQPERGVTYWDWSLAPVKDSSGKVMGLVFSLRETTESKQAEEALRESEKRLRRYNRILEEINWIFSNVMQAKTEEELGEVCLSVALKITGSEFGFINEIGADRTLYDVAKSQLGWERCLMEDKTEHRNSQSSFIIHGLYGNVIINEKSFFTNEPQSHPDSIGVPSGHPPIKSFLGVPLVQNGKTVGLIAVANRENGYSCEQLEDLEAIAPAVTQALQRKKAEEALKKAHEKLEEKVKERTIELEKAFNSLKESETSLTEAQEMAKIGNWVWDIATDKAYWSNELYHIFGRDPQKLAPAIDEFYSYIHPDDRHDYVNLANKALNEKSSLGVDVRIISDDGVERRVYLQSKIIFNETNDPVQIKGIVRDITESKKAEEKIHHLANIVESSEDAIGTLTLDGTIISWNKGAEKVYGYSVKEILGKCVSILAPPNLDKETIKLIEKIKQREQVNNYDTLRLRKDGKTINVSITLSPVFDTSGKLTAVSFISRDITKRKEAEEALTKIEITRKQEIHHRIKNNLQVISSLLDLQAEKFRGKKNIEDSQILEAFKESQDRVISMAIIHEELHKGGEIDTLNFSHYIKELTDNLFLSYRLGNENTNLNMDIEENIFFDMDTAVPLGIIVNELISNSLKYAFPDRDNGEIQIKLHRENGECKVEGNRSTNYILLVSDNGVGIPMDLDIEDLDSLGLQLVDTLIEQLDGELELKRSNGTEFTIRFTVTEKDNQASAPAYQQLVE